MNQWNRLIIAAMTIGMFAIGGAVPAMADDDDDEEYSRYSERRSSMSHKVPPLYQSECGSCHFAFQPRFLPARSWTKIMATLDNHFGDNAELPADKRNEILNYLVANAGSDRRFSSWSGGESTPMRFTELRSFTREHNEVPPRMVKDNPQVRTFANCQACHTGAANGDYSEHRIRIPGFGRWED